MAETSAIEWTDSTWNPVTGCTKVSRGCDNCYAERFAERFRGVAGHPFEMGFDLTWTLRILSGISEGICNTMVQSGGEFLYIGVGGR